MSKCIAGYITYRIRTNMPGCSARDSLRGVSSTCKQERGTDRSMSTCKQERELIGVSTCIAGEVTARINVTPAYNNEREFDSQSCQHAPQERKFNRMHPLSSVSDMQVMI